MITGNLELHVLSAILDTLNKRGMRQKVRVSKCGKGGDRGNHRVENSNLKEQDNKSILFKLLHISCNGFTLCFIYALIKRGRLGIKKISHLILFSFLRPV